MSKKYLKNYSNFFKKKYLNLTLVCLILIASLLYITIPSSAFQDDFRKSLPPLQKHSLPLSLSKWHEQSYSGDYFNQIKQTLDGYLIWSSFPIKIYLDRPANPNESSASTHRFNQWVNAIEKAIDDWNNYLPMTEVAQPETADIMIKRANPPLGTTINPETGQLQIPRARSAQTRYEFYIKNERLFHRMQIQISPGLGDLSILSAARHELGHALGIWGHSLEKTDALYFSQVANPPKISSRDINTLKKIYEQPTRLGWPLPNQ